MYTQLVACKDHRTCPLDLARLRAAIAEVAKVLRERKTERRSKDDPPHEVSTFELRDRATLLCALRAQHRGRVHAARMTLEEQARRIAGSRLVI